MSSNGIRTQFIVHRKSSSKDGMRFTFLPYCLRRYGPEVAMTQSGEYGHSPRGI